MTLRTAAAGLAVLLACTTAACTDPGGATAAPSATTAAADGACRPVERPPLQVSSHLVGDAEPPGDFSSVPPTSGWHTSRVPEPGRHDEPLRDAEIVSALENGIVVLAVAPGTPAAEDDAVATLLEQFPDRLLVTTYATDMPTPVALLSWGVLQRCDRVDPAATTSFVLTERVVADSH